MKVLEKPSNLGARDDLCENQIPPALRWEIHAVDFIAVH